MLWCGMGLLECVCVCVGGGVCVCVCVSMYAGVRVIVFLGVFV